jgi:hypothetical protein
MTVLLDALSLLEAEPDATNGAGGGIIKITELGRIYAEHWNPSHIDLSKINWEEILRNVGTVAGLALLVLNFFATSGKSDANSDTSDAYAEHPLKLGEE